jgi:hypothetical protein
MHITFFPHFTVNVFLHGNEKSRALPKQTMSAESEVAPAEYSSVGAAV